jgi:NADH dehydrogenase
MNIYLVEGSGKTLAAMSEKSSAQSKKYLERFGVKVMLNTVVKDYNGHEVFLSDGKIIPAGTVIWAAGVKGNIPNGIDKSLVARGNRIKADRHCRVIGYNNVYVIGDLAYIETPKYPNGHPQLAAVAIQQGELLADYFKRVERKSNKFYEFEYYDKGTLATIGRNKAVADFPRPKLHFGGFLAWLIWMGLHLMLLLGVKNRFFVFSNWLYNYFTYDQNLRLIFKEFNRAERKQLTVSKKQELVPVKKEIEPIKVS